ncbi:hypothetical protein, partial [Salmonella enterica]|uniref:hypothetical protein n=1 Tax=Salmonella enterica TaxID=28901 RepID=UPI0020C2443F
EIIVDLSRGDCYYSCLVLFWFVFFIYKLSGYLLFDSVFFLSLFCFLNDHLVINVWFIYLFNFIGILEMMVFFLPFMFFE